VASGVLAVCAWNFLVADRPAGATVLAAFLVAFELVCWRSIARQPPESAARIRTARGRYTHAAVTLGILGVLLAGMAGRFLWSAWCRTAEAWQTEPGLGREVLESVRNEQLLAAALVFALACAAIGGMLGVLRGRRELYRRLCAAEGKCAKCGYLLTGLPEARCPECGTAFERAAETTQ
jgi:hypothetical protein